MFLLSMFLPENIAEDQTYSPTSVTMTHTHIHIRVLVSIVSPWEAASPKSVTESRKARASWMS